MHKLKNILPLLILLISFAGIAQEGNVEIIKDPRLDALIRNQADRINVIGIPQVPGYRIQLIFDNDKKKIDQLRSKFISQNPGVDTYVVFNAPNYVLKAGNFVERGDALRLRDQSLRLFPTAFVVKEMVNMQRLEDQ
jgi:hypothetical protein